MDAQPATNEEIIQACNDMVLKSQGTDDFRIKVFRRASLGYMPKHVATLGGASLAHIANAEEWLPTLAGGGPQYVLECFHASNPSAPVKGKMVIPVDGEPATPNPAVVQAPDWRGPKKWIAPTFGAAGPTASYGSPGGNGVGTQQGGIVGGPLAPSTVPPGGFHDPRIDIALSRLDARERELEDLKRKTEIDAVKARAEEKERDAQRRIDEMNREHARQLEDLKARIATPQKSSIAEISAAVAPLVTAWMDAQKAEREEQRRRDDAIREENRRRDDAFREEQRRRDDESRAQNQLFLSKLLEPKPLIDPAVEKLLSKGNSGVEMADAFSKMTNTTMRVMGMAMEAVAEKDPQNPAMEIVAEVRNGLETIVKAMQPPQPVLQVIGGGQPAPAAQPVSHSAPGNGANGAQVPVQPQAAMNVNDTSIPILARLVERVKRLDDVKKFAVDFHDALGPTATDDSLKKAMEEAKGLPVALFEKYVGREWGMQNQTYAISLMKALEDEYDRRAPAGEEEDVEEAEVEEEG